VKKRKEKKIQPGVISNGDYYYYYIPGEDKKKKKKERDRGSFLYIYTTAAQLPDFLL
jgi:hypothetical protein